VRQAGVSGRNLQSRPALPGDPGRSRTLGPAVGRLSGPDRVSPQLAPARLGVGVAFRPTYCRPVWAQITPIPPAAPTWLRQKYTRRRNIQFLRVINETAIRKKTRQWRDFTSNFAKSKSARIYENLSFHPDQGAIHRCSQVTSSWYRIFVKRLACCVVGTSPAPREAPPPQARRQAPTLPRRENFLDFGVDFG
jgi:hypothetical protein